MSDIKIPINNQEDLTRRLGEVVDLISRGLKGGPVLVTLGRLARSLAQNRKFHPLIGDIAKQVEVEGCKYHQKIWKAQLVDEFDQEMRRQGTPLQHETEVVWSLDRQRLITIRPSTTEFNKKECAQFIEFLYAYGIDLGVRFTDKSLDIYEQYLKS